ncbi:hypothetical protein C9374_013336 [Naegleria lovaniensis]|uniref:SH3 domain-containing protein n=1 Tax=Naegleria lovaniensis TaxID=51637 RepID=A0AA88KPU3_NAELO|nr:uncharacterized protein C9374_013336 [Naegleria lovaniensis]KAG2391851.1 hypothetical protein C9374_013336 [Naegleria lovaniensis]
MSQQDTCKVLYDFKADGENELSVSKGEIVRLISIHGEWMMVEKMTKPFQKGYVPTLYISVRNSGSNSESRTASSRKSSKSNVSSSTTGKKDNQHNSSSVISNTEKQLVTSDRQSTPTQASSEVVASTANAKEKEDLIKINEQQLPVANSTVATDNTTTNTTQQNITLPSTTATFDSSSAQATTNDPKPVVSEPTSKRSVATPSHVKSVKPTKNMSYATKIGNEFEESMSVLHAYEANEKVFKQTLQQREEAFKRIEQKLDKICQDVNEFQQRNDLLIERIKNLDNRIENDRLRLIDGISAEPIDSEIMNDAKAITKTPNFIERKRRTLAANIQTPLN